MTPIHILLADDHALVRKGLKQLFMLANDIIVAAEATNGDQVIALLRHEKFDVVVLDLSMPGFSGADLVEYVCGKPDHPPVLVLSMHSDPHVVRRALIAGASGYLTKDNDPEILLAAIRKVAAGQRFLDPALAQTMVFEAAQQRECPVHERLSEREREVFLLLARGLSINEIAERLVISHKTVSTHKSRLMEKMKFGTAADLVKYAIRHHLVD
jgi:DNA-binding NarL/FixJ family response regulator